MIKKTPYEALYYSTLPGVSIVDIQAKKPLPEVDVSPVELRMDKNGIYGIVKGFSAPEEYHWRFEIVKPALRLLYCQWDLEVLDRRVLAIVGPRNITSYGQQVLEELFSHLQHFNVTTVSGIASWVDTLCHELSIQYGIPTIAILGGWFATFLRWRKRALMERIVASGGLILSEYKHKQEATRWTFPQRNRIIAGIADAIFLPEARPDSGSLLTADEGIKLKKPVGAPMNNIFIESSLWTNRYITEGYITPISSVLSFIEKHFERVREAKKELPVDLTEEEILILNAFHERSEIKMREILSWVPLEVSEIMAHLSMLEMKWVIGESSPGVYVKKVCNVVRKS